MDCLAGASARAWPGHAGSIRGEPHSRSSVSEDRAADLSRRDLRDCHKLKPPEESETLPAFLLLESPFLSQQGLDLIL